MNSGDARIPDDDCVAITKDLFTALRELNFTGKLVSDALTGFCDCGKSN